MPRASKTSAKRQHLSADEPQTAPSKPRRTAPELRWDGDRNVTINVTEEYQLRTLYGTRTSEAGATLLKSALTALGETAREYADLIVAMPIEMEPRDAVEAMLVTQMAATHVAMTQISGRVHNASSYQVRESLERSMTRLSRTYLSQMDQLKKYRAEAQQIVRVERVEVNDGGQAIVGDVSYKRGGDGEK